jgi:hypothetical protein
MSDRETLPSSSEAWVEEKKIKEYLLNLDHAQGKSKAKFFLARGFSVDSWTTMRGALVTHASTNAVVKTVENEFGRRYTVDCACPTPDEVNPCIRSVWEVKRENTAPRLITAHPLHK